MLTRLAITLGALFLAAAAAVTFIPASPPGAECGSWVNPEWTDAKTSDLINRAGDVYDQADALGATAQADDMLSVATRARQAHDECASALSTRRVLAIVLLGLGILGPIALLFVLGGTRRRPPTTPATV